MLAVRSSSGDARASYLQGTSIVQQLSIRVSSLLRWELNAGIVVCTAKKKVGLNIAAFEEDYRKCVEEVTKCVLGAFKAHLRAVLL